MSSSSSSSSSSLGNSGSGSGNSDSNSNSNSNSNEYSQHQGGNCADTKFVNEIKNTVKFKLYRSIGYENEKEKLRVKNPSSSSSSSQVAVKTEEEGEGEPESDSIFQINSINNGECNCFCVSMDIEMLGDEICDIRSILDKHKEVERSITTLSSDEQTENESDSSTSSSSSSNKANVQEDITNNNNNETDSDMDDKQDINNDIYIHVCPSIKKSKQQQQQQQQQQQRGTKSNILRRRMLPQIGLVAFNMTRIALLIEATVGESDMHKLDKIREDNNTMTPLEEEEFLSSIEDKISTINESLLRELEESMCIINSPFFYEFSVNVEIDERKRLIISAIAFTLVSNSGSSVRKLLIKYRSDVNILSNIKAFAASRLIASDIKKYAYVLSGGGGGVGGGGGGDGCSNAPSRNRTIRTSTMSEEEKNNHENTIRDIALTIAHFTLVNGLSFTFIVQIYINICMYYMVCTDARVDARDLFETSISGITWEDLLVIGIHLACTQHTLDFVSILDTMSLQTITRERFNEITVEVSNFILNYLHMSVQPSSLIVTSEINRITTKMLINKYFI